METLLILLLMLSWSAGSMFTTADIGAKEKGWNVSNKILPIIVMAWILYPFFIIQKMILPKIFEKWENSYEFSEWSLLWLGWSAKISTPFLALLIAPWYAFLVVLIGGFLLSSWLSIIFFKSHTKTVAAFLLLVIYTPIVYILLG